MTKLRFLKNDSFCTKSYIDKFSSHQARQVAEIRLNMCKIKENFRSQYEEPFCRLCRKEKETTEHTLTCLAIESEPIDPVNLTDTEHYNTWTRIISRMDEFEKRIREKDLKEHGLLPEEDSPSELLLT